MTPGRALDPSIRQARHPLFAPAARSNHGSRLHKARYAGSQSSRARILEAPPPTSPVKAEVDGFGPRALAFLVLMTILQIR